MLEAVLREEPGPAWARIAAHAWEVCSQPLQAEDGQSVLARDRAMQSLDTFLAAAAWDLWRELPGSLPGTADELAAWWSGRPAGRAVLMLDGLSLREVPWLLQEAPRRGMRVVSARPTRSELPGDTNPFARAMGLSGRAALENNQARVGHRLPGARTEATDLPFEDCTGRIGSEPDWWLWHHWPDHRLHELAEPGKGLLMLSVEAATRLRSDGFWELVRRLATGRRLLLTSDHGYGASGLFPDASEEQGRALKELFRSGRHCAGGGEPSRFLPPTDLTLGAWRLALGRRRWRSQGGYPTLAHGGLTVLEILCPFVELERIEHG